MAYDGKFGGSKIRICRLILAILVDATVGSMSICCGLDYHSNFDGKQNIVPRLVLGAL